VKNRNYQRLIVASLLVVVLVVATGAAVWHHHDKSNLQPCQICHLSKLRLAGPPLGPTVIRPAIIEPLDYSQPVSARIQVTFRRADFRAPPA
jgi:hypothetical protein